MTTPTFTEAMLRLNEGAAKNGYPYTENYEDWCVVKSRIEWLEANQRTEISDEAVDSAIKTLENTLDEYRDDFNEVFSAIETLRKSNTEREALKNQVLCLEHELSEKDWPSYLALLEDNDELRAKVHELEEDYKYLEHQYRNLPQAIETICDGVTKLEYLEWVIGHEDAISAWKDERVGWYEENDALKARVAKLEEVLREMMFAYKNKDGDMPHDFEIEAVKLAEQALKAKDTP